ncbi:MAG: hypothetical protein OEL83_08185 [Desulforhopalus sp.]|nr:hypothetical protein [Desulforhopalus sp.]
MTTFFFSRKKPDCVTACRWQTCPQRYLAALRNIDELRNIRALDDQPSGVGQFQAKAPRCGDLVILYIENLQDLDAMVGARDAFEGLKKILVIAGPIDGDDRKYHLLEPRYITQAGRNLAELEAVICKMTGYVN